MGKGVLPLCGALLWDHSAVDTGWTRRESFETQECRAQTLGQESPGSPPRAAGGHKLLCEADSILVGCEQLQELGPQPRSWGFLVSRKTGLCCMYRS